MISGDFEAQNEFQISKLQDKITIYFFTKNAYLSGNRVIFEIEDKSR